MSIRARRVRSKEHFWEMQLMTAMILFLVLYVAFSSKIFIGTIVKYLYGPGHVSVFGHYLIPEKMFIGMGKYGRDCVLGYALYMAVSYWLREERHGLKYALLIVALAEMGIEFVRTVVVLSTMGFMWNFAACMIGTGFSFLVVAMHEGKLY